MYRICEQCEHGYDDENCWTICPHGPLWAAVDAYCRECDLVNCHTHCAAPDCRKMLPANHNSRFCSRKCYNRIFQRGYRKRLTYQRSTP